MSANMSVTILIVGATGKQGGAAISALFTETKTNPNLSIRFLTRNPDSPSSRNLIEQGAKAYKADLLDGDSLKEALTGVNRAYLVTDAMAGAKEIDQGRIFIDAARECGVGHIVFSSSCAADTTEIVPHFNTKGVVSLQDHITLLYPFHSYRSGLGADRPTTD
jgi:uncharacterized protein YbjT (DUF2867 family)